MTATAKIKERAIILHPHELRAALDDRLSLIVRPVIPTQSTPKVPPLTMEPWVIGGQREEDDDGLPCWAGFHPDYPSDEHVKWFSCPWDGVGWRLRVREALTRTPGAWAYAAGGAPVMLDDDDPRVSEMIVWAHHNMRNRCPAHQMPRFASRLTYRNTGVSVGQIQSIGEDEARSVGINMYLAPYPIPVDWPRNEQGKATASYDTVYNSDRSRCATSAVGAFARVWDSIYGKRPGLAWSDSPWCWFIVVRQVRT